MRCGMCAVAALALALGVIPAAAAASTVTVLKDARLIDGTGTPPREHTTLVIEGERITAVGPASMATPAGAQVVDLAGKTVMPGLISDHSHLGLVDGTRADGANATVANIERQLRQFEAYGVTTVMSLGLNGPVFYQLRPQAHAGTLAGSDMFGADRGIGVEGGAPPVKVQPDQLYRPDTPEQARQDVREMAARHTDLVKLWLDDFHGTLPARMSPEVYKAVIDEAHAQHLRVAAHVYYLEDAKRLVADGVDILAHGVRDRPVDQAFIDAMKVHGTWYIPTLGLDESFYLFAEQPQLLDQPFVAHALQPPLRQQLASPDWRQATLAKSADIATNRQSLATNEHNLKTLYDAGVKIGFGTDSGATPLRVPGFAEHRELKLLTDAGLTPLQAIQLATQSAAGLLGLSDRGVLAPGKRADFVVLADDPTQDIGAVDRIDAVWHRGREVSGAVTAFQP